MNHSSDSFSIRPATNEDGPQVRALVFGVLEEYGLASDPANTDADLDDIEQSYAGRGGSFDVLVDTANALVATVGLYPIDETTCELRKMYLLREHRGKGLGERLLLHALERARQIGFSKVTLETASVLTEASALYRKYGFREFQASHLAPRCDQAYYLDLTE